MTARLRQISFSDSLSVSRTTDAAPAEFRVSEFPQEEG